MDEELNQWLSKGLNTKIETKTDIIKALRKLGVIVGRMDTTGAYVVKMENDPEKEILCHGALYKMAYYILCTSLEHVHAFTYIHSIVGSTYGSWELLLPDDMSTSIKQIQQWNAYYGPRSKQFAMKSKNFSKAYRIRPRKH